MTIEELKINEKTVSSFMGGDKPKGSPAGSKRQTSLLSFFSSPSPKRPAADSAMADAPNSPSKKTGYEESPLIASSSLYEMVSDMEEDEVTASLYKPLVKGIVDLQAVGQDSSPCKMVSGVEREKAPASQPKPTTSLPKPSAKGMVDLQAFAHDGSLESEPTNADQPLRKCRGTSASTEDDEKLGMLDGRDTSSDRYPWLVNIRDAEGKRPGKQLAFLF
jgi:hypothetical protein